MPNEPFEQFQTIFDAEGSAAALNHLGETFQRQKQFHELFEILKMKNRQRLNLPLTYEDRGDELSEADQRQLEDGLMEACRTIGTLLIQDGQLRDGYNYLRPLADGPYIQSLLKEVPVTDDNVDPLIEICFHEGMDVARGMQLMLSHYGICNSITTFESAMYGRPRPERAIGASLLLRHLHDELKQNVTSHIEREEGTPPANAPLSKWMQGRDWLTEDGAYHVDTTHLASVVRLARDLKDDDDLQAALELVAYGSRLDRQLQYPGDPPFEDLYESHRHYFGVLTDRGREAGLEYFREKAEACNAHEETTFAIELYVDLLNRIGRGDEAIEVSLRLIPDGTQTTGFGPSLFDLCRETGDYETLKTVCRSRNDLLGFAMGVLMSAAKFS